MKSVDVIILSWDRLQDTIAAIQSSLDQMHIDLNVIVVDQGSKPENLSQLEKFCASDTRITLIKNTINSGVPGGRNQASFAGKGDIIVALDNDAVFADNAQLKKTVDMMTASPEVGILAFRIKCYGADSDDASSWPYSPTPLPLSLTRFKTTRFVGAGHAIRRDVFEKIGGYDEALFFMHEEVDLAKRFINAGYEIIYTPDIVVCHKVATEHRVSWSGKRFYYDVRNRTYLHIKLKTSFPTFIFHTVLLLMKGIRLGYGFSAFKGLAASIMLLPRALRYRFSDVYVQETEKSKAYFSACNPPSHKSIWKRAWIRLQQSTQ